MEGIHQCTTYLLTDVTKSIKRSWKQLAEYNVQQAPLVLFSGITLWPWGLVTQEVNR